MILFTSDINKKGIASGMLLTFAIMIFGAVYEHFSFGVYSEFMIYAFVPMLLETSFLMLMNEKKINISSTAKTLLRNASVTASVGCAATGIVAIYGTENRLLKMTRELSAALGEAGIRAEGPFAPGHDLPLREIHILLPRDKTLVEKKAALGKTVAAFEQSRKYTGHIVIDVDPV